MATREEVKRIIKKVKKKGKGKRKKDKTKKAKVPKGITINVNVGGSGTAKKAKAPKAPKQSRGSARLSRGYGAVNKAKMGDLEAKARIAEANQALWSSVNTLRSTATQQQQGLSALDAKINFLGHQFLNNPRQPLPAPNVTVNNQPPAITNAGIDMDELRGMATRYESNVNLLREQNRLGYEQSRQQNEQQAYGLMRLNENLRQVNQNVIDGTQVLGQQLGEVTGQEFDAFRGANVLGDILDDGYGMGAGREPFGLLDDGQGQPQPRGGALLSQREQPTTTTKTPGEALLEKGDALMFKERGKNPPLSGASIFEEDSASQQDDDDDVVDVDGDAIHSADTTNTPDDDDDDADKEQTPVQSLTTIDVFNTEKPKRYTYTKDEKEKLKEFAEDTLFMNDKQRRAASINSQILKDLRKKGVNTASTNNKINTYRKEEMKKYDKK